MEVDNSNNNNLKKIDPVCPYCGQDPINFAIGNIKIGNLSCAIVFCSNSECRKLLNIQVLEIEKQILIPSIKGIKQ